MLISRSNMALCIAIASVIVLGACGGAQSRLASHMQRGEKLLAEGNFAKASIEFRNAMQIAPKDPAALVMAGKAAEGLGRLREAMGLYQAAVDAAPDDEAARAALSRLMIFAGQPERALALVAPALAKHPDSAVLLTYRAAARLQLKDSPGALADIERALQIAPTNEDAIALRASMYRNAGNLSQAAELVSAALRQQPNSTNLHELLASVYMDSGDAVKTEEQLRALITLKPRELSYRNRLALFYISTHRLDDAQRALEDAAKAMPQSDEAKLALVDFIASQRTRAQGESTLRAFIAREPDNYDLRLGLGALLQRSGAIKEADQEYNEIIRRDGTGAKGLAARDRLATIAAGQARYDDARKLIDQVLQKSPRDNDALALRGEISLLRNDPAGAIADLRAVLRDQPNALGIYSTLARAYVANGEPALAEQLLRTAMDADPTNSSVRIELAKVLVQSQRAEQAVTLLEETVRRSPTDADAREALVHAYLAARALPAAATAAQELTALRPDSPSGPYLSGIVARDQKRLDDAQKDFERALALQPRAFEVMSTLARLELERGQGTQAITLVKSAVERDPKSAPAFDLLGQLYLAQHNTQLADQALNTAITLAPNWWAPYRNLALVKFTAKDMAGAATAYQQAIQVAPAEPQPVTELGELYRTHGRADEAIALYDKWNRRNPTVQAVANNLAMLLVTYKNDPASLDRARDLAAGFASTNDVSLLDTNGWVHFKRAEYKEALTVLQRAVERAPDAREIRYHLGMTELQVGQKNRARDDLKAALSGSATFTGSDEARTALAALEARSG